MIIMKLNTPTEYIKVDSYQDTFFFESFILPRE